METVHVKLSTGSVGIGVDVLEKATRKMFAYLTCEEDIDRVMQAKYERFPPVIKKPSKSESPSGD